MSRMKRSQESAAICLDNAGHPVSLERGKTYQVLPDLDADQHGQVRVVDESGEDYLYPRHYFEVLDG